MAEGTIRIDKFLWFARITKTRALAQALAEDGHFRVDGKVIDRAHSLVRIGSVLTFAHHGKARVVRVNALPVRRGPPSEAAACITDLRPAVDVSARAT